MQLSDVHGDGRDAVYRKLKSHVGNDMGPYGEVQTQEGAGVWDIHVVVSERVGGKSSFDAAHSQPFGGCWMVKCFAKLHRLIVHGEGAFEARDNAYQTYSRIFGSLDLRMYTSGGAKIVI